jgi:hypothetical protein
MQPDVGMQKVVQRQQWHIGSSSDSENDHGHSAYPAAPTADETSSDSDWSSRGPHKQGHSGVGRQQPVTAAAHAPCFDSDSDSGSEGQGVSLRRQPSQRKQHNQLVGTSEAPSQSTGGAPAQNTPVSAAQGDGADQPEMSQGSAHVAGSSSTPAGAVEAALARATRPPVSRLVVDMMTPNILFSEPPA